MRTKIRWSAGKTVTVLSLFTKADGYILLEVEGEEIEKAREAMRGDFCRSSSVRDGEEYVLTLYEADSLEDLHNMIEADEAVQIDSIVLGKVEGRELWELSTASI